MEKKSLLRKLCLSALAVSLLISTGVAIPGSFVTNEITANAASTTVQTGTCGDNITYTLDSSGTLTLSGYGSMKNTVFAGNKNIKKVIIEYGITNVGDWEFENCTAITSVSIPASVEKLGYRSFFNCSALEEIIIPDNVTTINDGTFCSCTKLKSINIPDSVTYIGTAFDSCPNLTKIVVDAENTNYASQNGVLFNKTMNRLIMCPQGFSGTYTIPNSVTVIGEKAFSNCKSLTGITIPDSVKEMEPYAFAFCSKLESVTIPKSVTSIDGYVFSSCTQLKNITIPDSVTIIRKSSFDNCDSLTKVTLPNSLTTIGDSAFYNCQNLTSINIPDSVTTIQDFAFWGCMNLKSITIPETVTRIGGMSLGFYYSNDYTLIDGFTIIGKTGSAAETYAVKNGVNFDTIAAPLINNSTISADTIQLGEKITVNAAAEGGKGTYTYLISYKKATDTNWTVKQDYGTKTSVNIKPGAAAKYTIKVRVKDSKGTITGKNFTLNVTDPLKEIQPLKNESSLSSNSIKLGEKITVNAKALDGTGTYTYLISYKKSTDANWTIKQNYGTKTSVNIKPGAKATYTVKVRVKDSSGTIVGKNFTLKVS